VSNHTKGIEQWTAVANTLNKSILDTGRKIDINNTVIWQEFLHRWDNSDWQNILSAFNAVCSQQPDLIKPFHQRNYENAVTVLNCHSDQHARILDTKPNKKIAWAMIMTLREVFNELNEHVIANEDRPVCLPTHTTPELKPRVTTEHTAEYTRVTVWHNLFEVNESQ
jgi:hypothetical protein